MKTYQQIKKLFFIFCFIYFVVCAGLYFWQEKLIFVPTRLEIEHKFSFNAKFDEINLTTPDGVSINGLHFYATSPTTTLPLTSALTPTNPAPTQNSTPISAHKTAPTQVFAHTQPSTPKGAILFFHGNAGSIDSWGRYGEFFASLGYDFFVFDYRGFGKSSGAISGESELYGDANLMFEAVQKRFAKDKITLLGYSIGSGISAHVAQNFGASRLILVAPYFNFADLANSKIPFAPKFLIKYKIPTHRFAQNFALNFPNSQILIFHGKNDEIIDISHSQNLAQILPENAEFYELDCTHNDILSNPEFREILKYHLE